MKVYLIGSLKNPKVPIVGNALRNLGFNVFDEWFAGGPEADDEWQKYEQTRGRSYPDALYADYATHIWAFDKHHLDTSDMAILIHPAGRSAHIELGYMIGQKKPTYVLFEGEPERYDVMYRFVDNVFFNEDALLTAMTTLVKERKGNG